MSPLSTPDKLRVALAPLHALIGALILVEGLRGAGPAAVALGGAFLGYGVYRILLVRRALRGQR